MTLCAHDAVYAVVVPWSYRMMKLPSPPKTTWRTLPPIAVAAENDLSAMPLA